jgi:hypothetical protein
VGPSSRAGIPDRASSHPPAGEADSSSPTPGTRLCVAHFHLQSVAFRRGKSVSRRHKKGPGRAPSFARAQLLRDESCSAHPTLCSPAAWQTATGRWPGVAAGKPSQHRRPDTIAGMTPNGTAQAGLVAVVNRQRSGTNRRPTAALQIAPHANSSSTPQVSTGWLILLTRPRTCRP